MINKIFLRSPSLPLTSFSNENFDAENFLISIYLSSKELYKEQLKEDRLSKKDKRRLINTLSKYWIRSCTRATPFGTFAGANLVNLGNTESKIILNNSKYHLKSVRLDSNYLHFLVNELNNQKEIRDKILFFPNNSLYEIADKYRYVEFEIRNDTRHYQLTSVNKTNYLAGIINKAKHGATLPSLTNYLAKVTKVDLSEAEDFINSLWSSQILISELEPALTGEDPICTLISQLEKIDVASSFVTKLKELKLLFDKPKIGIADYQAIEHKLKLLSSSKIETKNIIQVDMFLSIKEGSINQEVIKKIQFQADQLRCLARPFSKNDLNDFIRKFKVKYENEEIPLVIALDPDLGIGYSGLFEDESGSSELIADLDMGNFSNMKYINEDYIIQYTISKFDEYIRSNDTEIEIKEDELKKLAQHNKELRFPRGQAIFGTLLGTSSENFCFDLKNFGGYSSVSTLGRFGFNKEVENYIKSLLLEEEKGHAGCVYAEIIHLPEAKVGNVLQRPIFSNYEIPYMAKPGVDKDHQIEVEDLMVSIDVQGEVVLRSKKLNKRIIPRLTTAHYFSSPRSLPVYKFLCDLQSQGLSSGGNWDWGELELLKFLPRVFYKNLILRKAKWKRNIDDFKDLPMEKEKQREFMINYLENHKIPNRVTFAVGDEEILIDFTTEFGVQLFIDYLKKYKSITISEYLIHENNCIVFDQDGNPHVNEIVIPLISTKESITQNHVLKQNNFYIKGKFAPNSEWCYFKIYCGTKSTEQLLATKILDFIENGIKTELFEKFFFIRYKDESSHLRFRFFNQEIHKQINIFSDFNKALQEEVQSGFIHKITLDTYNRELNRYGSQYIEEVETLFFSDSLAVLKLIQLLREVEDSEKYRVLFALRGIDLLLDDFNYNLFERKNLLKSLSDAYFKEFGGSHTLFKQLNLKYRYFQNLIFSHLNPLYDKENGIIEAVEIFSQRTKQNRKSFESTFNTEDFLKNKNMHISNYMHMFINRLFVSKQREYELVVYNFLYKYYNSKFIIEQERQIEYN